MPAVLKWILIAIATLSVLFICTRAYYGLVVNPQVVEELRNNPDGERADIVTLLTFPDGKQIPVNYLQEGDTVFLGADGSWWRDIQGGGADVSLWIRGKLLGGHARVVLDDPDYTHEIFARLRPNAPNWLPDWLNGKLIVINLKEVADLIFVGSQIITIDPDHPSPNAVAVRGDKILAVGSREEILSLQSDATRIVELGDRALVPGFIDAHGHMVGVGSYLKMVNLSSPPVGPVHRIDDVVRLLKNHIEAKAVPEGDWVFGYGYDDSLIEEVRHPDRDDLDKASTTHPIVLIHVSGHLAAVNSAALAASEITADTDDPPGGVIRRRPGTRVPNGVMEETAGFAFRKPMEKYSTPDSLKQSFRESARLHASYGITTVQDGGSNLEHIKLFREAANESPFPVDIVVFPFGNGLDDETFDSITHDTDYSGGFRVGGIKFLLDGSPQGRTAYLSKPYNEGPPGAAPDYRAYPVYPEEAYNERVARLIRRGVPVLAHANGDGAIDVMINGVAKAVEGIEMPDHRSVIIHAQLMREDQLHRVKQLGLVPSYYSAHPFFWGDWHRLSFGDERASFISPVARTAELGIPFTVHNDAPIVPPDIMRLLWITVNRETRSGYILGPDQRAAPMQALHAVTLGAAYQYFEEDRKGSITPGKQADLVILGATR